MSSPTPPAWWPPWTPPTRGESARRTLRDAGALIISPVVLSELDHVAATILGRDAAHQAIDDIVRWTRAGRAVLARVTADVLGTAQAVRNRYRDRQLDLADAVTVAFAEQFRTNAVLTLDHRDFRAVRPLTEHAAFRLLPADA